MEAVAARARAPVTLALVVAVVVNIAWGSTPVATRLAVEDISPMMVAVLRTVIAGLVAAPILLAMRTRAPVAQRSRGLLALSALTGFVLFPILYTLGQERTSATHGALILAALPVFTGAWAALVDRRMPRRRWLLGCGIALAGEAVMIGLRGGSGTEPTFGGDLLILAAATLVSLGYVAGALLSLAGYKSLATTLWGVALGAVVMAPLGLGLVEFDGVPSGDAAAWGSILFLALVTSIVGYVGWYWALARGGIARIATVQFIQPFSGLALAALVLDERLTPELAIPAAAVLAGVWIAQRR
jgi:drug/metabolite transporter (DMT)-like permease